MYIFKALLILSTFSVMSLPAGAQQAADAVAPEATTAGIIGAAASPTVSQNWMVSAANPLAARAAARILRSGGSAADAAIAAQLVLGLVEPQSSGLGGGAFVVYFDAASSKLTTLDGRETAPGNVTPRLFQDDNGQPLKFFDAVVGGRSVGVPGTPKLLDELHNRWGTAKWQTLFADAIGLAENGFAISPRLAQLIERDAKRLAVHPATKTYFFRDEIPLAEGEILKNPEYAATLRIFLSQRSAPFYSGEIARDIVTTIRTVAQNPGVMQLSDLDNYQIKERQPVCVTYRLHDVCGMGPPSSGALAVGQILGILAPFKMKELGPTSAVSWQLIADASRLAFADRGRYMADSDYVPLPIKGLVDPDYLATRSALINPGTKSENISAGTPKWDHARLLADDESLELPSTSHISIVDANGNVLSMTTTIENAFGSRLMVRGFLLNNELTDFSFRTHRDGVPIANRVEPGKRPRSSMSPTIVMKDGKPKLVIGSPGGSRIIPYVANTIIAVLDWGMNIQQAINMPHLVNRFGTFDLEKDTDAASFSTQLEAMGYKVKIRNLNSGLHGIAIGSSGLEGGADPRREGVVIGE